MTTSDDLIHQGLPSATFSQTARLLLEQRLGAYGLDRKMAPGVIDDIYLVTAELINNACIATPNDSIAFKVRFETYSLWPGVWDSCN